MFIVLSRNSCRILANIWYYQRAGSASKCCWKNAPASLKLWLQYPERVKALFDHRRQRVVFGFEHPTLGVQALIENARWRSPTGARAGTRLHLVTHSAAAWRPRCWRAFVRRPLGTNDLAVLQGNPVSGAACDALKARREIAAQRKIRSSGLYGSLALRAARCSLPNASMPDLWSS